MSAPVHGLDATRRRSTGVAAMIAAASLAALVSQAIAQQPPDGSWLMVGGDARHSGVAAGPAAPFREAWSVEVGEGGPVAGPVVAEGKAVVLAARGVMGLDGDGGEVAWRAERVEGPAGAPAIAGDLVLHASGRESAAAIVGRRVDDGREVWRAFTDSSAIGSLVVAQGVAYVGTSDGSLLAIDAATGEERWRYEAGAPVEAAPAVGGGLVLAVSQEDPGGRATLHAIEAEAGSRRPMAAWNFTPPAPTSAPAGSPATDGAQVYLPFGDRVLRALDLEGGTERWGVRLRDFSLPSQVALSGSGVVVVDRLHVARLDPETGEEAWAFRLADLRALPGGGTNTLAAASAAVSGEHVVLGDAAGVLSAIDARTGRRVWRQDLGDGPVAPVAVTEDHIYAATLGEEGSVIALEHDAGAPLIEEVSPTVLNPGRALISYVVAFAVVFGVTLALFRFTMRRRLGAEQEGAGAGEGPP